MITIPLSCGAINSHQNFTIQLGENFLEFTINYITRSGEWSVDIRDEGILIVAGAMLNPNSNIIKNYNVNIGRLVFVGDKPTLDNLGKSNSLVWEDA